MKKLISVFAAFVFVVFSVASAFALDLSGGYAIVTDYATGSVIYEKNADVPCVPASMTKVMAMYVFFSEMETHGLSLESPIRISRNVARLSVSSGLSNVKLTEGQTYTVDSLLSAICTASACAAVVALAEAVSGSEKSYVELMNSYVGKLGLSAYYADCYGISQYNRITPRSMAALAKKIIDDFPFVLNYTSKSRINWEGSIIESTNFLLPGLEHAYAGVDGLKTGHTGKAGYCLTATAVKDGRRIISVVFGTPSKYYRDSDSKKLLDYGFAHYPEQLLNLNEISCEIDAPDQVFFDEDFTVCAALGGVSVPRSLKGEWLVNDVPIYGYQYDSVWVDNGSKIYFNYNTEGYTGGSVKVTFRLYTDSGSVNFDKTVNVIQEYKPQNVIEEQTPLNVQCPQDPCPSI